MHIIDISESLTWRAMKLEDSDIICTRLKHVYNVRAQKLCFTFSREAVRLCLELV